MRKRMVAPIVAPATEASPPTSQPNIKPPVAVRIGLPGRQRDARQIIQWTLLSHGFSVEALYSEVAEDFDSKQDRWWRRFEPMISSTSERKRKDLMVFVHQIGRRQSD